MSEDDVPNPDETEADAADVAAEPIDPDETEEDVLVDPETEISRIRIDDAMCNPIPLYISGVGQYSLRIGNEYDLPPDAIAALENVGGLTFTTIEIPVEPVEPAVETEED